MRDVLRPFEIDKSALRDDLPAEFFVLAYKQAVIICLTKLNTLCACRPRSNVPCWHYKWHPSYASVYDCWVHSTPYGDDVYLGFQSAVAGATSFTRTWKPVGSSVA